jgi:hypothetical protein
LKAQAALDIGQQQQRAGDRENHGPFAMMVFLFTAGG